MTEIRKKEIIFKNRGKRYCAVDNHNTKSGRTKYQVIFSSKNIRDLNYYMIMKVYQP